MKEQGLHPGTDYEGVFALVLFVSTILVVLFLSVIPIWFLVGFYLLLFFGLLTVEARVEYRRNHPHDDPPRKD